MLDFILPALAGVIVAAIVIYAICKLVPLPDGIKD